MKHCRDVKAEKRRKLNDEKQAKESEHKSQLLDKVLHSFPAVGKAIGLKPSRANPGSGKRNQPEKDERSMSEATAELLAKVVFQKEVPRGICVGHDRLTCFAATLSEDMQQCNLLLMLAKCSYFRSLSTSTLQNIVVGGYSHQSDSTCQQLARKGLQKMVERHRAAWRLKSSIKRDRLEYI